MLSAHGCQIASSICYAAKTRPPSRRAVSDAVLWERIEAVQADRGKGRGVAGYRKMWHLLRREGVSVARCTVARLMAEHGMKGVVRGREVVTTKPDDALMVRPGDLVMRDFAVAGGEPAAGSWTSPTSRPGQVLGFTAFVTDAYSRRIVGWRTHHRMPTELPPDALEMALWCRERAGQDVTGLVHHCDAGSQNTARCSWRCMSRLSQRGGQGCVPAPRGMSAPPPTRATAIQAQRPVTMTGPSCLSVQGRGGRQARTCTSPVS
ncbi:IS3 family transposase [Aestuariimicrobium ganziense]|uniref:IS3 family transposase n=1 Tax=Aestuariimicrobium ganziense TaxID=2773677 RepID=UPI002E2BD0B3|nr:IS3 family transposase [Aestuariimicrobium ganziense]